MIGDLKDIESGAFSQQQQHKTPLSTPKLDNGK